MKIKNIPSWLKGIIITYLILILITIIFSTIFLIFSKGECASFLYGSDIVKDMNYSEIYWCFNTPFQLIVYSPVLIFRVILYFFGIFIKFPASIIPYLIFWVILGAIIGWIIGRRKKKRKFLKNK